jgi:hypothetical protein
MGNSILKRFQETSLTKINIKRATTEQIAIAKEKARKKRIFLSGPFSGNTSAPWLGKVLGKHKMTIITGGRLGAVNEVVQEALGHGAKNISVILSPWETQFNPNIKGKARNIISKGNERTGTRAVSDRLGTLLTHKVKGYAFLYPGPKTFSGTMMELQALVNAYTVEAMTKQQWKRPIILVGAEWKPVFEQIKNDYASKWNSLKEHLIVVENEVELERTLTRE